MLDRLIQALAASQNEAADDVLLQALRLGTDRERSLALGGLLQRATIHGLCGVIGRYHQLSEPLQVQVLQNIKTFHHALREAGRSDDTGRRLAAMKLIALGRQGKLAYVLSENMHEPDEQLAKAAVEAMVALARWVAVETRRLQGTEGQWPRAKDPDDVPPDVQPRPEQLYRILMDQRPEIEAAVARAMDVHRGRHGADLLRACLLMADWAGSKTLAILNTTKHGGQSLMVRRLQQPPEAEHVDAFLLGATHGQLRTHFGNVFSHINEAPVLDALLRKTHWLKDHQLQICLHQVTRGVWWDDTELAHDCDRRPPHDAALVGEWLAVSGVHDVVQDERMARLLAHCKGDFHARLRLFRTVMRRRRGASCRLITAFLDDPDERLVRMAARELIRRKPADYEGVLIGKIPSMPESVRRTIARAIGQAGFEQFWNRFDYLPKATRKSAGKAMLKLLPDAPARLVRKLTAGPLEQRLKAMQVAHELDLGEPLRPVMVRLCADPSPKVRSKAVSVLGAAMVVPPDVLVDRLLNDSDPRVRANTIEVLETKRRTEFLPVLAQRARGAHARERANAIKALHRMRVGTATSQLGAMLKDDRGEHRISALWTLRQIGWWGLLSEVGRIAKQDENLKVRRYALTILKEIAELAHQAKAADGGAKKAG
ncbi:MAG TPA: HEAT repeat domain-containing protein [Tepidisphaeraceae bacterium]|nr:HEAT repeat domain-containing protein [Tepidisphaeraceae bacterium]